MLAAPRICTRALPGPLRRTLVSLRGDRLWVDDAAQPISWLWLRDACPCPQCVHPTTRQKLHRSSDIPLDIAPVPAAPILLGPRSVSVQWPGSHSSVYTIPLLEHHASSHAFEHHYDPAQSLGGLVTWDAPQLRATPTLWFTYNSLCGNNDVLLRALGQLVRFGLVFISGVPTNPTDNAQCETRRLASRFGSIRNTFYGDLWDVKNNPDSHNIAYTDLNLDLHMDLLYLESPPNYQILHSLRNRVRGGTSVFVDAFQQAYRLRDNHPQLFEALSTRPISFHYHNDGHSHHHSHRTIELASSTSGHPMIKHINYSPPFQAPFVFDTPEVVWKALKVFASLLENSEARFEHLLKEGEAVIFDNRRVLHARTAFQSVGAAANRNSGRWLKGCYLEGHSVSSKFRVMRE